MGNRDFGDGVGMGALDRVGVGIAIERLHQFKHLSNVISDEWLQEQMKKDVSNYSLITGWLTTSSTNWKWVYHNFTKALEDSLELLSGNVSVGSWENICRKLKAKSERSNTKGTLSEISFATFLASRNLTFEMERQLNPPKDVDFSVIFEDQQEIHIEMQFFSESDRDQRLNTVSAAYGGMPYRPDFEGDKQRVIDRVYHKVGKLTDREVTLVAFDCTDVPLNGGVGYGTIPDALRRIFKDDNPDIRQGENKIRQLVDGVIWFQIDFDNALQPVKRGYFLNEHSKHQSAVSLQKWIALWSHEDS